MLKERYRPRVQTCWRSSCRLHICYSLKTWKKINIRIRTHAIQILYTQIFVTLSFNLLTGITWCTPDCRWNDVSKIVTKQVIWHELLPCLIFVFRSRYLLGQRCSTHEIHTLPQSWHLVHDKLQLEIYYLQSGKWSYLDSCLFFSPFLTLFFFFPSARHLNIPETVLLL